MSNKYYRGLINLLNDVKYKLQLTSMTLKINENKNSISGIKNDISGINNFSNKINDNETNISSNLLKINDNTNDIASNLTKIDTNTNNIDEINSNLSNIDFNSVNKFSIENFFIYNIEIEKNYILNKDKTSFSIFKYNLEDDFKKGSILEIDCRLLYRYNNYNHIGLLQHVFKLYDDNDNMFYDYKSLKTNAGDNTRNDLKQNDFFYVKLNDNYNIIKIELLLSLINNVNSNTSVDCRLYNTYKSNFLNVKYYKKINTLSVNNNLTNLKNVYNIKYYDYKKEIKFNESFFNKTFNLDFKKDDFVDIDIKMKLEYEDINNSKIINTVIKLYNDMDEEIFESNYNNKDSISYSNFVFLNKNILYNFIEDTKFLKMIIKFEFLQIKKIKSIHYIPENNNRLYIKHYGN